MTKRKPTPPVTDAVDTLTDAELARARAAYYALKDDPREPSIVRDPDPYIRAIVAAVRSVK